MSKRSKEMALKAYPPKKFLPFMAQNYRDKNKVKRVIYRQGYKQAEKDLGWHSVKESLPPMDEEVIVLTDNIHGTTVPGAQVICFGHRPNPDGWDGKNIDTGKVTHHVPKTYDGWNIPGVTHWMYCPKLEEE